MTEGDLGWGHSWGGSGVPRGPRMVEPVAVLCAPGGSSPAGARVPAPGATFASTDEHREAGVWLSLGPSWTPWYHVLPALWPPVVLEEGGCQSSHTLCPQPLLLFPSSVPCRSPPPFHPWAGANLPQGLCTSLAPPRCPFFPSYLWAGCPRRALPGPPCQPCFFLCPTCSSLFYVVLPSQAWLPSPSCVLCVDSVSTPSVNCWV